MELVNNVSTNLVLSDSITKDRLIQRNVKPPDLNVRPVLVAELDQLLAVLGVDVGVSNNNVMTFQKKRLDLSAVNTSNQVLAVSRPPTMGMTNVITADNNGVSSRSGFLACPSGLATGRDANS
jgi:hypothetical protein